MNPVHKLSVTVTADQVDGNRHANNVAYVQWMQDAAVHHADASGSTRVSTAIGASWVVRSHHIEYLSPAFAGDVIEILTWVSTLERVRSLRKYRMIRTADQALLARAETEWIFVDAKSGRPRRIPDEIRSAFPIAGSETEP